MKDAVSIILVVMACFLSACAAPSTSEALPAPSSEQEATGEFTPTPSLIATETAVIPTLSFTPTPTSSPSPTSSPTATFTATPTSTPTFPAAVVPSDWRQYTSLTRQFSFLYPPSWELESEASKEAVFNVMSGKNVAGFFRVDLWDDQAVLSRLATLSEDEVFGVLASVIADSQTEKGNKFKLVATSKWEAGPLVGFEVESDITSVVSGKEWPFRALSTLVLLNENSAVFTTFANLTVKSVRDEDRETLAMVLRSFRPKGVAVNIITPTPTNTRPATNTPPPKPTNTPVPKVVPLNQEFQTGGWKWHLYDVKKTKAVYWYGDATVAQGYFLLVFIQFANASSGTARPYQIQPFYLTDSKGNRHYLSEPLSIEREASLAAGWQFQAATLWQDFKPGEVLGAVEAWDLPPGTGDVFLTVDGITIYLGNFDEIPETK